MTDDEQQSGDAKLTESGLGAKEKEEREADDGQDDDTEKGDLGRGLGTGPWACGLPRGTGSVGGPWDGSLGLGSCTAVVYCTGTREASAKCLAGRATERLTGTPGGIGKARRCG